MAWTKAAQTKYSRPHSHLQNDLTDREWEIISPMIPRQGRMGRPRKADMRRVFDAAPPMPPKPNRPPPAAAAKSEGKPAVNPKLELLLISHAGLTRGTPPNIAGCPRSECSSVW